MQSNLILSIPLPEFIAHLKNVVREVMSEKNLKEDKLLTSRQVMELCNVSAVTLQKWRNNNKIPFTRIDSKIFYVKENVLSVINKPSIKTDLHAAKQQANARR